MAFVPHFWLSSKFKMMIDGEIACRLKRRSYFYDRISDAQMTLYKLPNKDMCANKITKASQSKADMDIVDKIKSQSSRLLAPMGRERLYV